MDRSDAIEIQHPDDWFYIPLFGLERQQQSIERAIAPFLKPNISPKVQRILPKGVILQGLPGTGKTTLVKNISKKFGVPLVVMRADRILNLYLGESEKRVAEVFKIVDDFKKCIIFIDDGEALFPRRDMHNAHHTFRTMEQVLFSEIDNLNPTKTQIIIATNKIDMLDPALISRVSLTLDFEKPKLSSILSILNEYLNEIEHDEKLSLSKEIIAEKLLDHDGREITGIIGSAICNSLVNNSNCLTLGDMLTSLEERNIISHGDADLINGRVLIRVQSSIEPRIKTRIKNEKRDIIDRGEETAFHMQKLWNKFRNKATFVSGKYPKILLKIVDFEGFDGTLNELLPLIENSTYENFSLVIFKRIIGKYKKMGLMDYSTSSPLKINKPLWDLKAYVHELSENEIEGLSIIERELKEKQKEIEVGSMKLDLQKDGSIIGIKSRVDKSKIPKEIEVGSMKLDLQKDGSIIGIKSRVDKSKIPKEIEVGSMKLDLQKDGSIIGIKSRVDKSKIPKEIEVGSMKLDLQKDGSIIGIKSRVDKSKIPKEIEVGSMKLDQRNIGKIKDKKETSIQDFMTLGEKLSTDETTNKSREFLNKLHNESTKLRQSRKGAKSIFQGKLYYQILESLDECEGKTKRDFYTYLVKKYKRKNYASYQTYFPHLEHLNLVEEKDRILKLEPTGIQLISYIKEYGLDNILEGIPKKD